MIRSLMNISLIRRSKERLLNSFLNSIDNLMQLILEYCQYYMFHFHVNCSNEVEGFWKKVKNEKKKNNKIHNESYSDFKAEN